jgi:sec-independent protein translocase protein TatB
MFGMGFMEIFLVLIVAVIALGPEKLPSAAVDLVKFFKKFKSGLDDAKSTLDSEINLSEMRKEAEDFKSSVSNIKNIANLEMQEITNLEEPKSKSKEVKEKVSKKEKISFDDKNDKAV